MDLNGVSTVKDRQRAGPEALETERWSPPPWGQGYELQRVPRHPGQPTRDQSVAGHDGEGGIWLNHLLFCSFSLPSPLPSKAHGPDMLNRRGFYLLEECRERQDNVHVPRTQRHSWLMMSRSDFKHILRIEELGHLIWG